MRVGIITRNKNSWCSSQLREGMKRQRISTECFNFREMLARVGYTPKTSVGDQDLIPHFNALITRPIGRGSLEEIIFRMNLLQRLERLGMLVINSSTSIERSVDKFCALSILEEHGLPVPRTAVTESYQEAVKCFRELGENVVVKPLFGSRGVGSTRISDPNIAERIFRTISFHHGVLYLQEFVPHGGCDIRAFVVNNRVVASMHRKAETWKTNVSLGAKPVSLKLNDELGELAVKTAEVIGCKIAGVDILEGPDGPSVIELNSQPGWRGLQSVTKINIADEIVRFVLSEVRG